MTQTLHRNRLSPGTTTDLIPTQISTKDLCERTIYRKPLDCEFFGGNYGRRSCQDAVDPATTAARSFLAFASEPCQLTELKKAQQAILNVNRKALFLYFTFCQAGGSDFSAYTSVFGPNVVRPFASDLKTSETILDDGRPDFYEPIAFGWTETADEIAQAVKRFSEDTHADY